MEGDRETAIIVPRELARPELRGMEWQWGGDDRFEIHAFKIMGLAELSKG